MGSGDVTVSGAWRCSQVALLGKPSAQASPWLRVVVVALVCPEPPKAFLTLEGGGASTASTFSLEHGWERCPAWGWKGPSVGRVEACLPARGHREQV